MCIILLLMCSGCLKTSEDNTNDADKNDTLTWGVLTAENIYPLNITNDNYWTIVPNVFEGLVEFDETFRIIPALAVSWNNPDSLTWRFFLRHGVVFHNDDEFTAEDVRYSFEMYHSGLQSFISDIVIVDEYTVEFKTIEPKPGLLSRLAHTGIIYCDNVTDGQIMVGTGPYRIADYELGTTTTLERFDGYWGEKPAIKTVVFQAIEDENERLQALRSGAIDIAEYNVDERIDEIMQDETIKVVKFPPLSTYIIGFDMRGNESFGYPDGMNPTADVRVRQAIYHAINITPLIDGPFHGFAVPESQFINPNIYGYNPEIIRLSYNLTTSRQLLADAGYENGFDIVMDCITEGFEYNAENCQMIAAQLEQVGIRVTLNELSMDEYNSKVVVARNTSMYLVAWGTISADGGDMYDLFIRSVGEHLGYINSGHYSNQEVDRLGAAASQEMDSEERLRLLKEGFRIALVDDVVVVPLFSQELLALTSSNVSLVPRADLRSVVKDIIFI